MTLATPRVSFLLPTFDALPNLPRALDSLRQQTFPDWEAIVVDDGSTDGTPEWLRAFVAREPRLCPLLRPHQGLVASLQAGLAVARGEWIARMDADDLSAPERLAEQLALADRAPHLGLIGSRVEFGGDRTREAGYAAHVDWLNSIVTESEIANARFVESPFAHPSVLFRRSLVQRLGGYRSGPFPEDYELWLRWLEAGVAMAKAPRTLLRWNDSPRRLSRTDPRYDVEAFFRVKAGYLARWLETHVSPTGRSLWVWGAGRLTRRRVEHLRTEGARVQGFIDIDPRKQGLRPDGRQVIAPEALPGPRECFVVGYVSNRGAREIQRPFLVERGFVEGTDFIFAA